MWFLFGISSVMIRNLFVVDDDSDDVDLFEMALAEIGRPLNFTHARDGFDLMKILEQKPLPEVIFLDINMPGMNGWDTLRELRNDERYKKIPVVMYSTSSVKKEGQRALDAGALCFYQKPSRFSLLRDFLTALMNVDSISQKNLEVALREAGVDMSGVMI
jgi:CheY-like chemotaxis protein